MENQELRNFSDFLDKEQSYCTDGNQIYIDIIHEFDKTQQKVEHQIAILKDQLEFASEEADLFAKVLKEIWDSLDEIIDGISYDEEGIINSLDELKRSIPENALRR